MPPRNKPFDKAYNGVVIGAQVRLKEVNKLKTIAANIPPEVYHFMETPLAAKSQTYHVVRLNNRIEKSDFIKMPVIDIREALEDPLQIELLKAGFDVL